jgi:hypothetical protein
MMAAEVTGIQVELAGKRRLRRDSEGDMPVEYSQFHTVAEPLLVRLGSLTRTHSVRSKVADCCCSQGVDRPPPHLEMKSLMLEIAILHHRQRDGKKVKSRGRQNWNLVSHLGSPPLPDSPLVRIPFAIRKWLYSLGQCRLILTCVIFANATVPLRSGFAVGAKAWLGKVIQEKERALVSIGRSLGAAETPVMDRYFSRSNRDSSRN